MKEGCEGRRKRFSCVSQLCARGAAPLLLMTMHDDYFTMIMISSRLFIPTLVMMRIGESAIGDRSFFFSFWEVPLVPDTIPFFFSE